MNRHLIDSNATLLEAMSMLNSLSGDEMTLFVTDGDMRVSGTLTDGDIRRALLAGASTASPAGKYAHRSFRFLRAGSPDIAVMRDCREKGIKILPVIDSDGRMTDIVNLARTHTILPVSALLMAGGKGERLRPLTLDTPKPLLEIAGKAIIDYNIEALAACGVSDITVATRYLAEKIYDHFASPVAGVKVKCIREDKPLGTLGAASLISHKPGGTTLVMNSDLLTSISFEDLYTRHITEDADITVAVIPYQVSVPYAILTTDGPLVTGITEKPAYSYYANAGIYMISNELLNLLSRDARIDATDFVEEAVASGRRVTFFPVDGTWIDVGSPTDFRQAAEIMRHHRNMSNNIH